MRPMPAPLGLYIHIPFCKSKCDYCDFYSLAGQEEQMDRYQRALLTHLRSFGPRMKGWVADTVYFGGGTPSYYGEKRLREILSLIQRLFTVSRQAEITVEEGTRVVWFQMSCDGEVESVTLSDGTEVPLGYKLLPGFAAAMPG